MGKGGNVTKAKVLTIGKDGAALHYVGDGSYIYGVPARDLSADEAAQYADKINANAKVTGQPLYAPSDSAGIVQEGTE